MPRSFTITVSRLFCAWLWPTFDLSHSLFSMVRQAAYFPSAWLTRTMEAGTEHINIYPEKPLLAVNQRLHISKELLRTGRGRLAGRESRPLAPLRRFHPNGFRRQPLQLMPVLNHTLGPDNSEHSTIERRDVNAGYDPAEVQHRFSPLDYLPRRSRPCVSKLYSSYLTCIWWTYPFYGPVQKLG